MTVRLLENRHVEENETESLVGLGKVWPAGDRPQELADRPGVVEIPARSPVKQSFQKPSLREPAVDRQGLFVHRLGPRQPVALRIERESHPDAGGRQARPGQREVGIGLPRLLEARDRSLRVLESLAEQVELSLQVN